MAPVGRYHAPPAVGGTLSRGKARVSGRRSGAADAQLRTRSRSVALPTKHPARIFGGRGQHQRLTVGAALLLGFSFRFFVRREPRVAILTKGFVWSGRRESNPRSQLGKLMFCL